MQAAGAGPAAGHISRGCPLQARARGSSARRSFLQLRTAAICLQAYWRSLVARRLLAHMQVYFSTIQLRYPLPPDDERKH